MRRLLSFCCLLSAAAALHVASLHSVRVPLRRTTLPLLSTSEDDSQTSDQTLREKVAKVKSQLKEDEAAKQAKYIDLSVSEEDFEAGKKYGDEIRNRFFQPRIDDPGLPFADSLVCISGAIFIAYAALLGVIPYPSWLSPMDLPALPFGASWRGVPYILPALSHGAALSFCWILGALAASNFSSEAYMGTLQTAVARTWRAGAFSVGVLLFSTQLATYVSLSSQGLDPYTVPTTDGIDNLAAADTQILKTAFEVICDVVVQAGGLTGFRIYRWADARQYKR